MRHEIGLGVDRIRQELVVKRQPRPDENVKSGTLVQVHWPHLACSIHQDAEARFLPIADAYLFLNPHLSLAVEWLGRRTYIAAPGGGLLRLAVCMAIRPPCHGPLIVR